MAINEWNIWKRLGLARAEPLEETKVKDDLGAVISFLKEIDVKELIQNLEKMKDTVRESSIIREELKAGNLKKQVEFFDVVLEKYDLFQSDADINGLRLKKIAKKLLAEGKERGLEVIAEKKKDLKWRS